jgi:hypothetical protein
MQDVRKCLTILHFKNLFAASAQGTISGSITNINPCYKLRATRKPMLLYPFVGKLPLRLATRQKPA